MKIINIKRILNSKHDSNLLSDEQANKITRKMGFKKKHSGFVISLEVMLSLLIFTQFSNYTMYVMRIMNAERYISTILTSTASQAARWGGNNTKAFKNNSGNSGLTIQNIAQKQLDTQVSGFGATVSVTPETISGDTSPNNIVTVQVSYTYPSAWNMQSKIIDGTGKSHDAGVGISDGSRRSKTIKMPSIMEYGKLL